MRRVETQEQTPLTAVPVEREEVPVRTLRAVPVVSVRQTATTHVAAEQALVSVPSRRTQVIRRPFRRVLEEALNGGDSVHQPWADLFETLAICLASGMTTPNALRYAARKAPPELRAFCEAAARETAEGVPLHCVLARHKAVPEVIAPILEHGTLHGTLESSSRQASKVLKRFADVDRKFAYSAVSPDFALPLALCATMPFAPFFIGFFTTSVVPFAAYCAACLGISIGVWKWRYRLARVQPRSLHMSQVALRNSRAGLGYRALATARWGRTLSALVDCGVPISSALEAAADAARNGHYAAALRRAAVRTREGRTLHESLTDTRLLPSRLLDMINTGETAGELGPLLDRFADTLEDDAKMLAAQRFGMKIVGGLLLIAGMAVAILASACGMAPADATQTGLTLFALGLFITWLLFLTQARNDL